MRIWFLLLLLSTGAASEKYRLRSDTQETGQVASLEVHLVEEEVEIKNGDCDEVVSLLKSLVPDATLELSDDRYLVIRGSQAALEQVLELLEQLDQPPDQLTVELRVVLDKTEMKQYLGGRWAGQSTVDEQPEVKQWEFRSAAQAAWVPGIASAENPDFVKMAPWILSSHQLQTLSGHAVTISDHGVGLDVTPHFKQDGYVVMKLLPELNDGFGIRKFSTDARLKLGETLVLGGLGRAEDLGLAGEGPILLMITVTSGW